MEELFDHMDDLIGKVLAGEATAEEKAELNDWVGQSADHRKYVDQLRTIFETAASRAVEQQFDTDAAWKKVRSKLGKTDLDPGKTRSISWSPLRIAAGIIFVSLVSFFVYKTLEQPVQTQQLATNAQTVHDTLPDGSTAFLNKKSVLSFEYDPGKKTRKVKLKGEAFFEVKHEAEKPFVIETDEVLIKDLGTAFNVRAYPESNTVEVIVESGEVQIYTLQNPGLNLQAGEKGVYDKGLKQFSRIVKIDTNSLSYKTRVFSFNNTDLGSVVDMLNDVYNVKIKLGNEAIRDCHLTVNFNNEPIESVVEILAETLNLKVRHQEEVIVLEGPGCK